MSDFAIFCICVAAVIIALFAMFTLVSYFETRNNKDGDSRLRGNDDTRKASGS